MSGTISDSITVLSRMATLRAKRVVYIPFALAKSVTALATGQMPHLFGGLDPKQIEEQTNIPVIEDSNGEAKDLTKSVTMKAGKEDWFAVADLFQQAEARRQKTDAGKGHYSIIPAIVEEIILHGAGEFDDHPDATWRDRLSRLETSFDNSNNNVYLAILVARAHVAVGWAHRGDDWASEVTDDAWKALAYHCGIANDFLAPFDSLATNSPALANAKHMTARWQPDKRGLVESFEEWVKLDPISIEAMQEHAFFLLPRWCGTYFEVELFARRMVRETEDQIGQAAYAIIYLSLLETEPTLIEIAHAQTFKQAVLDFVEHFDCPATVNNALSVAAFLAEELWDETKEPDVVEWEAMIAELIFLLVTKHLDTVALDMWGNPEFIWFSIGACFREEFAAGGTVGFRRGRPPVIQLPDG